MRRIVLAIVFLWLTLPATFAVMPDEILPDATLEARARAISQQLRCLVCQNQTIDDSDATLARDLRVIVRERLKAGDSDDKVIDYVVQRYGNYVLLKPPFQADTLLLWILPFGLLISGLGAAWAYLRQQPVPDDAAGENEILKGE